MTEPPERIWIPKDPNAEQHFGIVVDRHDDIEYVRADLYAKLEATLNRVERLMDAWAVEGFVGSDELASEVRAALEGGDDE